MTAVAAALGLLGCGSSQESGTIDGACPIFASELGEVSYGAGAGFGQAAMPAVVLGPPDGAGCCQGSLDVVALGDGGAIVLGFGTSTIVDGPGPDFVVFENPFEWSGGVFAELATVAVSEDGTSFVEFPCSADGAPYGSCAGAEPVYLDGDPGGLLDPELSGGDAFDLAELGLTQARWVRVTDRADLHGIDGSFDLDAVGIVNAECP